MMNRKFLFGAFFAILTLAVLLVPLPAAAQGKTRHLTIDAQSFEFQPGRVEIQHGDRVIIEISAQDVVHGFYLDGYGIKQRIEPGVTERVEFTATKAGKFHYRCSVSCGPLHPFMIGELVVKTNTPYWRALGSVGIAMIGMLIYLWKQDTTEGEKSEST